VNTFLPISAMSTSKLQDSSVTSGAAASSRFRVFSEGRQRVISVRASSRPSVLEEGQRGLALLTFCALAQRGPRGNQIKLQLSLACCRHRRPSALSKPEHSLSSCAPRWNRFHSIAPPRKCAGCVVEGTSLSTKEERLFLKFFDDDDDSLIKTNKQ
jgi:hypothetical protein